MADHAERKTGEPTEDQKLWMGRIHLAIRYQEEHGNQSISNSNNDGRWDVFRKASAGDFNSRKELGDEAIDVNLIYANQKTTLPPLWLQDPYVSFTPTRARIKLENVDVDNTARAKFAEVETNYWLQELRFREEVLRPCVIDTENTNHGYCQVGYTTEKQDVEADGEITEHNPLIRIKQPFLRRVSPKNVLLPPGNWKLDHAEWIAIRWPRNHQDALKRFNKTAEELKSTRTLRTDPKQHDSNVLNEYLESEDAQQVDIYEVWDKRNKEVRYHAEGSMDTLEVNAWTIETEGFPLVDMSFVDISDDYYGSPPTQYYYAQNKELNAVRTQMRKRFSRSKSTILTSSDIGDEVITEYKQSPDGTIIKTGIAVSQGENIEKHFFVDPGLQQDQGVLTYESRIMADAMQLSGESMNQRGAGDPNISSATAAATVDKYVQVRATDKGDRVRSFTLAVARKLYMVCRQLPNEKLSRLIAGEIAGSFSEIEYERHEIVGEFALNLDVSSFINQNPQTRFASAIAKYNLFRGDPLVNPEALILDVYKAENIPSPEQYLLFLREPEEEFQLILQGLPVEVHQQDKHEAHMEAHINQADQVRKQITPENSNSDQGHKMRMALAGLMMHMNGHGQALAMLAQQTGRQPGQPINQNMFRNTQAISSGRETAAELGGNPLVQ